MNKYTQDIYKEKKYFSTTRNYTLSLINAFNNIKYWVENEDNDEQKEFTIPIAFGNYEKAISLSDISDDMISKGNFNFLPRLVLSFEGMSKAPDRQTNKFKKLTKKIYNPEDSVTALDASYNSVSYDYHYTLLLQARGLTIASQVAEEIMVKFNPSLNLEIKEFPIFPDPTETQILIADPAFEIIDEFDDTDVNIIAVTFDITVRGNIYSPIELSGTLQTLKMFINVWDTIDARESKLASYYKFDVAAETNKIYKETKRVFTGISPFDPIVESKESSVIEERTDYNKYQSVVCYPENQYIYNYPLTQEQIQSICDNRSYDYTSDMPIIELVQPELNPLEVQRNDINWLDNDPGANAFSPRDGILPVAATNDVDITTPGDYILTYSTVSSSGVTAEKQRVIKVI